MAGGFWTSQNKILPGVYINTKSAGNVSASIGSRGIVAICEGLDWGATGVIQTITPGESLYPFIGYDITNEKTLFLREMMKGTDVSDGPIQILLYRPAGTGGVAATASIGDDLTVTAKYPGVRGNDISIMASINPDADGAYDVATIVDGSVVDLQTVNSAADLVANAWVTFAGETLAATAGTALTGGVNPTVAAADHSAFLTALESYFFDIVIYDGDDSTVAQAYAAFAKRISERVGYKCQCVMAGSGNNSEWVIQILNGVTLTDGTVLTAQQATWWVGGAEAGARYNQSLTYAQYPQASEATPKLTEAQLEAAVLAGQIAFTDTFGVVKICTDINSLTTYTVDKGEEYHKNRVMRVLNQLCNDIYRYFSLNYIGKVNNNAAGRALLRGWIVGYLQEMQANNGVQNFVADDVTVEQGNSVDSVLINIAIMPVDAVEKIFVSVTVSVAVQQ